MNRSYQQQILMEVIDSGSSGDSTGTTSLPVAGITSLPSEIITSHILTKLDVPSVASLSCLSHQFNALGLEFWENICSYTIPSTTDPLVRNTISDTTSEFRCRYRPFYFDTFPIHPTDLAKIKIKNYGAEETPELIPELIYAVDVKFGDRLLYSKVVVTDAQNSGFVLPPFYFDIMGPDDSFLIPVKVVDGEQSQVMKTLEEKLKVSWILIDPTRKKAINLSSNVLVDVLDGGWLTDGWLKGFIFLQYATVMEVDGVDAGYVVSVACQCNDEGGLCVRNISMEPRGISTEGEVVNGKGILLEILQEAMKVRRTQLKIGEEKQRYQDFFVTKCERHYNREEEWTIRTMHE